MIFNEERRFSLKTLTDLYAQRDFPVVVHYMPKETSDPEGTEFAEYFDFLQSFYAIRGEYAIMEEDELIQRIEKLKKKAKKFGFPATNLDYV